MMQENICQRCNRTTLEKIPIDFHGLKVDRDMFCSECEYVVYDRNNTYVINIDFEEYEIEFEYHFSQNKSRIVIKTMETINNSRHRKRYANILFFDNRYKKYARVDIYSKYPRKEICFPYFKPDLSDIPKLIKKLNNISMLS